jgi:hypothetical protein
LVAVSISDSTDNNYYRVYFVVLSRRAIVATIGSSKKLVVLLGLVGWLLVSSYSFSLLRYCNTTTFLLPPSTSMQLRRLSMPSTEDDEKQIIIAA